MQYSEFAPRKRIKLTTQSLSVKEKVMELIFSDPPEVDENGKSLPRPDNYKSPVNALCYYPYRDNTKKACVVAVRKGDRFAVGVSRCSDKDAFCRAKGRKMAAGRALNILEGKHVKTMASPIFDELREDVVKMIKRANKYFGDARHKKNPPRIIENEMATELNKFIDQVLNVNNQDLPVYASD